MTKTRSIQSMAAAAGVALALFAAAGSAQARSDVNWSVGLSSPGVVVGVNSGYPVYSAPAPVYYAPRPVYSAPAPVYYAPPPPVYYAPPPPVYYYRGGGGYYGGGHHHHGHGGRGRWDR